MPYGNDDPTLDEQIDQHMENLAHGKEMGECWDEGYAKGKREGDRMREALLSYAAVQPLHSKHPGQIQRDLRAIAGEEHFHVKMISDDRCLICRHDLRHEIHKREPSRFAPGESDVSD